MCKVCHRIDGLETLLWRKFRHAYVCHRIDGLENLRLIKQKVLDVCHRIDGLEIHAYTPSI